MNLWNFVSGYVKINIIGDYPESLINRASAKGVRFYDTKALSDGGAACRVSLSGLKTMRHCARGSGCRVRISSKHGLPCALTAIKQRLSLFLLASCFAAVLAFASTRVLAFDVDCGGIDKALIFARLSDMGIYRGVSRSKVHTSELNNALDSLPGVVKAEVQLSGVVLHVKISDENTGQTSSDGYPPNGLTGAPIGIFASKDCVIASIVPAHGRALVRSGDAVKAGELLISGDYTDLKPGYYVDADGSVTGRVLYRTEATAQSRGVKLQRTGRRVAVNIFYLFGRELFFTAPFADYELEPIACGRFVCSPVAARIISCYCYELLAVPTELGEAEIKQTARSQAQAKLFDRIPDDAELLSLTTECVLNPDGSITATVTAVSLESIGYKRGIYD